MAAGRGWRSEAVVAEAAVSAEHGYAIRYRSLPGLHQALPGSRGRGAGATGMAGEVGEKESERGGGRGPAGARGRHGLEQRQHTAARESHLPRTGRQGGRTRAARWRSDEDRDSLGACRRAQARYAGCCSRGRRGERTDQAAGCRQTDRGRPRPAGRSLVASAGPGRCSQRPRESRGGCTVGARSHAHWITVQRDSASQSPRLARLPSKSYVGRV